MASALLPRPIGTRNNFLPGHDTYITRDVSDTGASMVAHEDAPDLAGWFQQQADDGQLYALFQREGNRRHPLAPIFPDVFAAAMARPKTGIKLPTAVGAPDFAWDDEENMVVAAKHGEECFFVNMCWRGNLSIKGAAMVFLVTPQIAMRAEVRLDDVRYVPAEYSRLAAIRSISSAGSTRPITSSTPTQKPASVSPSPSAPTSTVKCLRPTKTADAAPATPSATATGSWA